MPQDFGQPSDSPTRVDLDSVDWFRDCSCVQVCGTSSEGGDVKWLLYDENRGFVEKDIAESGDNGRLVFTTGQGTVSSKSCSQLDLYDEEGSLVGSEAFGVRGNGTTYIVDNIEVCQVELDN